MFSSNMDRNLLSASSGTCCLRLHTGSADRENVILQGSCEPSQDVKASELRIPQYEWPVSLFCVKSLF